MRAFESAVSKISGHEFIPLHDHYRLYHVILCLHVSSEYSSGWGARTGNSDSALIDT
jgi:hypothetical protein